MIGAVTSKMGVGRAFSRWPIVFAIGLLLLPACAQREPTPTLTPMATPTAVHTATPRPLPTATPTATLTPSPTPAPTMQVEELRFLALGDSYTIGQNVDVSERWPVQLVQQLQEAGINVAEPEIVARTGWTTQELSVAIDASDLHESYQLVTLLIGANNHFRGLDVEEYRAEFITLLQRAVAFAGDEPSHTIVLSIPDWSVTPFAQGRNRAQIAGEIDLFNAVNMEEATRIGARL